MISAKTKCLLKKIFYELCNHDKYRQICKKCFELAVAQKKYQVNDTQT
jgi:hypothetical protein